MSKDTSRSMKLPFTLILFGGVFFFANNHILTIVIPLYLDSLNASLSLIGYSSAAMGAVALIFRFACPPLFRKIPLTIMVFSAHLLLCIITGLLVLANHPLQIFLIRSIYGIPLALFPLNYLLLVKKVSRNQKELITYISMGGFAMPLSLAVSPFVAEMVSSRFSFLVTYQLAFVISLLSLLFIVSGARLANRYTSQRRTEPQKSNQPLNRKPTGFAASDCADRKNLVIPILCYFYLGVVDIIVLGFLPLYAITVTHTFSFYFVIFALTMVLSQTILRHFDFLKHSRVLLRFGYMSLVLTLVTIILKPGTANLVISAIFFGIGFSLVETVTNSSIISSISGSSGSSILNLQQLSISLGRTVSPFLFGLSVDGFGYNASFLIAGALGLVVVLIINKK